MLDWIGRILSAVVAFSIFFTDNVVKLKIESLNGL